MAEKHATPLNLCDVVNCYRYKGILVCEEDAVGNCSKANEIAEREKCFIEVGWIDPNEHSIYIECSDHEKVLALTLDDLITISELIWNELPVRFDVSLVLTADKDRGAQ